MSIFMKATLKVDAYHLNNVLDVLTNELFPLMEEQGWKLHGCFVNRFGSVKPAIITDLWEMEDMAHVERVMRGDAYRQDPRYLRSIKALKDGVLEESLEFMEMKAGSMKRFYD